MTAVERGESPEAPAARSPARVVVGVLLLTSVVAVVVLLPVTELITSFVQWAQDAGPAGALVFALVYVVANVLMLPATPLTLAGGLIYGPVVGVAVVLPAATVGASAAFLLGRTLFRNQVESKVASYPRFSAFELAIGRRGLFIMTLMRLSPVFPFNVLNYIAGLTSLRLRDYVAATLVGMFPGCVLYVYLGSSLSQLSALFDGSVGDQAPSWPFWLGLAATLVVTVAVGRIAKNALDTEINGP